MSSTPSTLPELLLARSHDSSAEIGFLDSKGQVAKSLTYYDLYVDAHRNAQCLIAVGLRSSSDIVVTGFPDHESHIRVLWACHLAGIPVCPLPPLHPDASRQVLFFQNIQNNLHGPTLVTHEKSIPGIKAVFPDIRTLSLTKLEAKDVNNATEGLVFPRKRVDPDDIACLMLTSGSTGNSKAVVLHHSTILSSIRGKIKHHGTSSTSRFFNWISFDHVASVTEAHLQALEANASQYHVQSALIVHRPRNLLEWCSRLRITYTFSPNFLLAHICRDVVAVPYAEGDLDLRCMQIFISGGEAVPIRTAVEFSDIIERHGAPRNCLRAGFGMSETGAGSIYDTRPIVRDFSQSSEKYLSLGKCCTGTSMRVISPSTGEVCSASDVGQLQLHGATVFREYYMNPEATAESFSADGWFITGDNAYLDKDGNLHLVGREKDYVNINGIKRPSVDVEHFIEDSAIDGVMRSFLYVCALRLPDTDTETYAIFYQHSIPVEDDLSVEDIRAISKTNHAVRNASVVFLQLAPHVVLPLPRQYFVKTALGKVSRTALTKLYTLGTHAELEAKLKLEIASIPIDNVPRNAVERIAFESVASALERDDLTLQRTQSIFDIGISSMHLIRFKHSLESKLDIQNLETIEILKRPELGQLCDYLYALVTSQQVSFGDENIWYVSGLTFSK